jgi:hypothetical protein
MPSSGIWHRVDLGWTDVSEKCIASIFKVEESASEEPAWAGGRRRQSAINLGKKNILGKSLLERPRKAWKITWKCILGRYIWVLKRMVLVILNDKKILYSIIAKFTIKNFYSGFASAWFSNKSNSVSLKHDRMQVQQHQIRSALFIPWCVTSVCLNR